MAGFTVEVSTLVQDSEETTMPYSTGGGDNGNSTATITEYSEYYYDEDTRYDTVHYTLFVLFIIVILVGLVCNTLSLVTFAMSKSLSKATTGLYLIALAVGDNIFLFGDFLRWLNNETILNLSFYDESNFWCKTIFFLRYFGKLVSAWITVAITVERFISIAYPLKAGQLSTKRNAYIVIGSTYVSCLVLTTFPFWTVGLKHYDGYGVLCAYLDQNEYDIWNWVVNRVGSLILPSIILFIFTGMIIAKLHAMHRQRKRLMNQPAKTSLENQLTKMLVAVAITFLLMRAPYTITYYIYHFRESIWSYVSAEKTFQLYTISKCADLLATTNYAINFILYCMAGSTFRSQFIALICCRRNEMNRAKTVTGHHTLTTSAQSLHKLSPALSRNSIHQIRNETNGVKY